MESLIEKLVSLDFWVTVIIANIIVQIGVTYAKSKLDSSFENISNSYKNRLAKAKEEERILFEALIKSPELRDIHRNEAIFERIRSVWFISFGIGLFVISAFSFQLENQEIFTIFPFYLGTFCILLSMKYVSSSSKKWKRAISAWVNANKPNQSGTP